MSTGITIYCPYCDAIIRLSSIKQTNRSKYSIPKFVENERTKTIEYYSDNVVCALCGKRYDYIKVNSYNWIKSKLKPSDTMLTTYTIMFSSAPFELFFNNIIGITRPGRGVRNLFKNHLHICFELKGKRAYLDCFRQGNVLNGLNVYEV